MNLQYTLGKAQATEVEKILHSIKAQHNNSYITIKPEVIKVAVEAEKLSMIAVREGVADRNVYYACPNISENTVLMHVKKNMYILIDREVTCVNGGQKVDVVSALMNFAFYDCRGAKNRTSTMCNVLHGDRLILGVKTARIERVIQSLVQNGGLGLLSSDYDVHHKGDVFDARQGCVQYLPSVLHTHRNRHTAGLFVESLAAFDEMCMRAVERAATLKNVNNAA